MYWSVNERAVSACITLGLDTNGAQRAILRVAEEKRAMALRKGWKFTKRSGEVILVRDLLEKIVDWINRFKATGDTIVQYDPEHAALPWAAVRFLLQIAVSEVELFGALVDDCK